MTDSECGFGRERPTVLVVDDDEAVRTLVLDVLAEEGYELHQVRDGLAARQFLTDNHVDVVITDLVMPGLDGMGLLQWAREHRPGISWIILSGRGTFDDAVAALQLGAFDFIRKPIDVLESLQVTVRNAVRQRCLDAERHRLTADLETRNEQLSRQVEQLKEACGLLCQQAETIGEDLRRAELIQRVLLPFAPPSMEHFCVDAIYRPSQNVGGDLYEVVQVDDRRIVLYVADAAGHGVSAAMLAVLFKHRLGTLDEHRNARSPAEVLRSVNESLLAECGAPGLFVTAAYALLDTATREMVVSSAGHPPLQLHRAGGEVEMIYHTGPALGLSPKARFAQKRFTFEEDDRLLLYTDGLCDAPREGRGLTAERIRSLLADDPAPGRAMLEALLAEAAQRRGGPHQEDDITLVLLTARAGRSTLDNGKPTPVKLSQGAGLSPKVQVLIGHSDQRTTISIEGRGTWEYCGAFHDACMEQLAADRPMTIDMSLCPYLDSTFLGTLQEVIARADRADVGGRIQGVLPEVEDLV